MARRADSAKATASFAHEIHNPLHSLLNLLYLLEIEATFTEQGHRYLVLAQEEVRRVSQIADEILNQQRGPESTNVVKLLRGVVDFYQSSFASRQIAVKTRYCADGYAKVYAGQLRQAFSNLLLNAADATPAGGTLHVRISRTHDLSGRERHGVRVTVADNGRGIAVEDLSRIFEPFFTTKGAEGSGIGLSLVRDVVRRHDGLLRVRSSTRPGRSGTVFAVFLPAQAGEPSRNVTARKELFS